MEYITASCVIRDCQVWQNGNPVLDYGRESLADFLLAAYQQYGAQYPKFYKMDHLSKLGWLAAEVLMGNGFRGKGYLPEEVAVVLSNASSSLDTDYRYFGSLAAVPSPALFVYTLPNIMIGEICIRHTWKGENAFFVFESFDAGFIAGYVCELLRQDRARACVCGWVEVLNERHSAALFLVEKELGELPFTAENLTAIMNMQNSRHG
ncbi:MAG TPA: hypothetical protein VKU83_11830 [Puia sp.]|nr:hypothetical protein [Puia sp.]